MTKQEFVDRGGRQSELIEARRGKAVDAFLDDDHGHAEAAATRWPSPGFGKFTTQQRAARQGVNPRNPAREGHDPGGARAEVLGGQPAQGRRQERLGIR